MDSWVKPNCVPTQFSREFARAIQCILSNFLPDCPDRHNSRLSTKLNNVLELDSSIDKKTPRIVKFSPSLAYNKGKLSLLVSFRFPDRDGELSNHQAGKPGSPLPPNLHRATKASVVSTIASTAWW